MKKVLSVLLAAAMVMGMSVSAFADEVFKPAVSGDAKVAVDALDFDANVIIVRDGDATIVNKANAADIKLEPGDDLYFQLLNKNDGSAYVGVYDEDWSINIKGNKYAVKASAYHAKLADDLLCTDKDVQATPDSKFVKVEVVDDLDEVVSKTLSFTMYLYDEQHKVKTENVEVALYLANHYTGEKKVSYTQTNYVEEDETWENANRKAGEAIFDFSDDVFFTVKSIPEEKVTLNLVTSFDKKVDKLFDYDAELSFYNFKGTKDAFAKVGELFIPADEDTFIYEVVDGKLVEIDAVWTDEYTISDLTHEYEGWVIETNELGYYVVSDIEVEIEAEEVETEAEANKANPETGAADFVGAAVAMAVVSVAAAGALALKK